MQLKKIWLGKRLAVAQMNTQCFFIKALFLMGKTIKLKQSVLQYYNPCNAMQYTTTL